MGLKHFGHSQETLEAAPGLKETFHSYHKAAEEFVWQNSKDRQTGQKVLEAFMKKDLKGCFVGIWNVKTAAYPQETQKSEDSGKGATVVNWLIAE